MTEINWNNPAAVEALLASEGLGNIDASIEADKSVVHIGVGRAAMTAASAEAQDHVDFEEDNNEQALALDDEGESES